MNTVKTVDQLLAEKVTALNASVVTMIDQFNAILAWRDTDSYNGVPYDKYRVAQWFYAQRSHAWYQAKGSVSVPFEQKNDLLTGFVNVAYPDETPDDMADDQPAF